jgi:hypothetical protein
MERRPGRRAISTPGERKDPAARGPLTVAASVVLHLVLVAVLFQVTLVRSDWLTDLMRTEKVEVVERVGFLQLPKGDPPTEAPRRGGDDRPATNGPPSAARVPMAPVDIPSSLPPVPLRPDVAPVDGGSGPLVGGGGPTRGVRPAYSDGKLWIPSGPVVTAPLSATERLDSALAPTFASIADSIRRAAGARDPNDWTKTIGGKKYGIDPHFIRLGPFSIPTPLLGLLAMNQGANPTTLERDRRLAYMRQEILMQAARAAREEEFNNAVKSLRERKQKERDEKKKVDPPPAKIIP